MIRLLLTAALAASAVTISGCSSGESEGAAKSAATGFVAAARRGNAGEVTFYRKGGFIGGALNTSVHVDDILVADLDPGTYVTVKAAPGRHTVYSDEKDEVLAVQVEPGKRYYYRVGLVIGMWKGHGKLEQVDTTIGSQQVAEWKLKLARDVRQPSMLAR